MSLRKRVSGGVRCLLHVTLLLVVLVVLRFLRVVLRNRLRRSDPKTSRVLMANELRDFQLEYYRQCQVNLTPRPGNFTIHYRLCQAALAAPCRLTGRAAETAPLTGSPCAS